VNTNPIAGPGVAGLGLMGLPLAARRPR